MKSLITYYSFSGNTDRIARIFEDILKTRGEVDVQRLKPRNEITAFLGQCKAARMHERAELEGNVRLDASSCDMILIGSPVWAFAPAPAVNTFLDGVSGLGGKKVIVLLTSGSGLGVNACFKYIRQILEAKGAGRVDEINIPDRKNHDNEFVKASLLKVI